MNVTNLGRNLAQLRGDKTQQEISHEIGINLRNYQRLESNNPPDIRLSTLLKILEYYRITLEDLLK